MTKCISHNKTTNGHYWMLIQNNVVQKLYETVAVSPMRQRMTFADALMLHLTWQQGDVMYIVNAGLECIRAYILSQRDCAASALMRVRWLPQELRLLILGYV
jgi:hypothetical protein